MSTSVAPESVPVAPITAPPAVERTFNATIAKVSGNTSIAPDPVVETPRVQFKRDEQTPVDPAAPPASDASATPTAAPDAPADVAIDAAPVEPTGEIAIDEEGITLRSERNADGTYKSKLDPTQKMDLEFKDKESGEIRKYSKTLPEVLRLAKDGMVLNQKWQEAKPEIEYYRNNVPKWQESAKQSESRLTDLQSQFEDMRALNLELLTAPDDLVIQHREHYARENSPTKVAERQLAELRDQQASLAQEQRQARAQSFIHARLSHHIASAESVLGVDLVTGMIARATQPLLDRNGQLPPERWHELEQYVTGPLQQAATAKKSEQVKATADAASRDAAVKRAQANAQQAVNDSTRTAVPVGRAAPDGAPASPKPKNVQDAIRAINNRPLPATIHPGMG